MRNYESNNNDVEFYYIYTGLKALIQPVSVEIYAGILQSFKDFLKNQQNDGEVKFNKNSQSYVLLPKYNSNLKPGEFCLPQTLLPVFPEETLSELRTYECKVQTKLDPVQDLEDLTYYLECRFFLTALDSLVASEGEGKNIMKLIVKEIFYYNLFNLYSDQDPLVILNSGVVMKFNRRTLCDILRKTIIKWREVEESVYHSDQLVSVWHKILGIMGTSESEYSYTIDEIEDSELYDSLQRNKKTHLHGDADCLHITLTLASKRDISKQQAYKIINSMDEIYKQENMKIEFKPCKEVQKPLDVTFETNLFSKLYKEEVITPIKTHYNDLLSNLTIEKNYMLLYGQKGTGKTFFIRQILPKIFYNIEIEYIDMNRMLLVSNNFNDMDLTIKYLSSIFLHHHEYSTQKPKIYVVDHIDCALPRIDSNEVSLASKKIKQNQLLSFFVNLIDSKKYNLLFVGRHYQNINTELAEVSRVDKFVQVTPPDFKKRKIAFEHIITSGYKCK